MTATADLIHQLKKLGLTQTAIAKRTGIPQPRLSRWQSGDAPVGADDALKLHALLTEVSSATPTPAEEVSHAG